ncbi:MAG TPA: Rid family hydrolase [Gammaproteobacteria bacterium]|nr:Rid family hydrolase [Gammaproteobacteria bacterium]
MRITVKKWLDMEFLELSAEARPGGDARGQTETLFRAFEVQLSGRGYALADTVRSRIFGRDRAARDAASDVRRTTLSGPARAATSSYIAPDVFASEAVVAMDLIALKPSEAHRKNIRENDPPRLPCRYLTVGPLVVFSGQTAVLPTLENQLRDDILPRLTEYLAECNSSWAQVVHTSCYLHSSQSPEHLCEVINDAAGLLPPQLDIKFVEGYSLEGKLVEVEVTAIRET